MTKVFHEILINQIKGTPMLRFFKFVDCGLEEFSATQNFTKLRKLRIDKFFLDSLKFDEIKFRRILFREYFDSLQKKFWSLNDAIWRYFSDILNFKDCAVLKNPRVPCIFFDEIQKYYEDIYSLTLSKMKLLPFQYVFRLRNKYSSTLTLITFW